ncbi:MAG: 30S ribosomal protein S9 [Bdellovibrionota bacterium]
MAPKGKVYDTYTVGRRKSSVARVYGSAGTGKVVINKRELRTYFGKETDLYVVNQPLELLKIKDRYDWVINVRGGGTTGQSGAIRLGIARALLKLNPMFRGELKKAGFLTRDSRKVERQKAGMRGARARYQFSKR